LTNPGLRGKTAATVMGFSYGHPITNIVVHQTIQRFM
jgi:hypothetical protein